MTEESLLAEVVELNNSRLILVFRLPKNSDLNTLDLGTRTTLPELKK
jgi:hypothetical protein